MKITYLSSFRLSQRWPSSGLAFIHDSCAFLLEYMQSCEAKKLMWLRVHRGVRVVKLKIIKIMVLLVLVLANKSGSEGRER